MSASASCRSKQRRRCKGPRPCSAFRPPRPATAALAPLFGAPLALAALLCAPHAARAQGSPAPPPDQATPAVTARPSPPPPERPGDDKPTDYAPPPTLTRPAPNPTDALGRVPNTAGLSVAALSRGKGPPLAWNPAWPTFQAFEFVLAGAGIATSVAAQIVRPRTTHWRGGILFDEGVRRAVRPEAYYARQTAEDASDVLVSLIISYPFAVDALGVAWWYRGSDKVAAQMALINAEAVAISMGLHSLTTVLGSRERPYGRTCGDGLDALSVDCTSSNRHRSYFSGHTSISFLGASLTCTHHAYLQLYGGGTPDTLVCASGLALAGMTGFFRILGDRHYATDVLSGAIIGSATGFLVPWLFHYRGGAKPPAAKGEKESTLRLYPLLSPNTLGVGGSFL
jgi:PAP2 superfamily protein